MLSELFVQDYPSGILDFYRADSIASYLSEQILSKEVIIKSIENKGKEFTILDDGFRSQNSVDHLYFYSKPASNEIKFHLPNIIFHMIPSNIFFCEISNNFRQRRIFC